jgi:hypothetical protein
VRSLRVAAVWVPPVVVAYCIAYAAVSWLLGFRFDGTEIPPFQHVRGIRAEVREVIAFERGGYVGAERLDDLARALGMSSSALTALDHSHPDFTPLETIVRLNPHPQVLRTTDHPYWLSVGYRSGDSRYHQITWYGGEADTTPSLLVVTPRTTGGGDYYVRYTMKVSKERTARPQIEALWWQAYRGASYDGFEEMGFPFAGDVILTPSGVCRARADNGAPPLEIVLVQSVGNC